MSDVMARLRDDEALHDLSAELAALGPLTLRQRAIVRTLTVASRVLRVRAIARDRAAFAARMAPPGPRDRTIDTVPHPAVDDATRAIFERMGVAGPFRFASASEATDLKQHLKAIMANTHNPLFQAVRARDPEGAAALAGRDDIFRAFNAHMYDPTTRVALSQPSIVDPLAALMGTDHLACWRSQVFQQRPGHRTTLHQNVAFPEAFGHQSLTLRPGHTFRPHHNLNAWVSLSRAGTDNGCLVVLGGSFRDTRVYDLGSYFARHPTALLTCMAFFPTHEVEQMLALLLFTSGNHRGVTKLMLRLADFFHDDLFAHEVERCDFVCEPGEFWVFSNFNMHGSMPSTTDEERFTLVGRYVNEDVLDVGDNRVRLNFGRPLDFAPTDVGWQPLARPMRHVSAA